jgi:NAD(P)-dependent dehydrogenase (short-subunit alcohol dehydrogenase family)
MKPASLKNKLALITGAGSGIGASTARLFAAEGARVIVSDRDKGSADEVADEIQRSGGTAWSEQLDVAQRDDAAAFSAHVVEAYGAPHILINNAGICPRAKFGDRKQVEVWDRVIQINLQGAFNVTHAFLSALQQTQGVVVNTASIVSFVSSASSAAYTVSKGGIRSFTQALGSR